MMQRRELNVSDLPTIVFGHRTLVWWGTAGLMAIEGMVFALTIASYFFLRTRSTDWPPGLMPPKLWAGTANLVIFLASLIPNLWAKKISERGDLRHTQTALVIMTLVGMVPLIVRIFEFPALMCTWDANAYGSVVWMLLGLHTVHLLTDWFDTAVLARLVFTRRMESQRFMDVSENC